MNADPPKPVPKDKSLDSALALLRDGNTFITRRCQRYKSDIFETRLLMKKTVCITGEEAARVFYEKDRFTRAGAIPKTVLWLLQDEGSVATLDGEQHRHRKKMFMSLMTPAKIQQLVDLTEKKWLETVNAWENKERIILHDEVQKIICAAVCEWVGIEIVEPELTERTRELAAMIDGAGAVGPRNWRGQLLRSRTERWARNIIVRLRSNDIDTPRDSALYKITWHRNDKTLLQSQVAAVEVINLLRPTVAVANYILFAVLALQHYPEYRQVLAAGGDEETESFVQEVRRFYPFFPFVGGLVREGFRWRNYEFEPGTRVLLDLYGTNHDPRIWHKPDTFQPERFYTWQENAFNFIPQGGGDFYFNHRCAGEWITIALMKRIVNLLTKKMTYQVLGDSPEINLSRMPALPKKPLALCNIRLA